MTVNEVAQRYGVSHQAVYKRLKARGIKLDTLKDKETGQLTPEGEAVIRSLFATDATTEKTVATEVERLTRETERLRNRVEVLEEKLKAVSDERDFLRTTLEHSQQLQAVTLAKLPAPPPINAEEGRLRRAWAVLTGKEGK